MAGAMSYDPRELSPAAAAPARDERRRGAIRMDDYVGSEFGVNVFVHSSSVRPYGMFHD